MICARTTGVTSGLLRSARETVIGETPAILPTSAIVRRPAFAFRTDRLPAPAVGLFRDRFAIAFLGEIQQSAIRQYAYGAPASHPSGGSGPGGSRRPRGGRSRAAAGRFTSGAIRARYQRPARDP